MLSVLLKSKQKVRKHDFGAKGVKKTRAFHALLANLNFKASGFAV